MQKDSITFRQLVDVKEYGYLVQMNEENWQKLLCDELHSGEFPSTIRRHHDGRLSHVVVTSEADVVQERQSLKRRR